MGHNEYKLNTFFIERFADSPDVATHVNTPIIFKISCKRMVAEKRVKRIFIKQEESLLKTLSTVFRNFSILLFETPMEKRPTAQPL